MFYTTPENAGVPSAAIERFIDRLEGSRLCMHDFLMIKGGGVLAEGYWKPFHADRRHRMYSVSKSFVSIAVGVMIGEGKLSLDDPVAGFFPELLPGKEAEGCSRQKGKDGQHGENERDF